MHRTRRRVLAGIAAAALVPVAALAQARREIVDGAGRKVALPARVLQCCERHYILEALEKRGWQINETALALGISRKSLWERRMRRLRITAGDDEPAEPPPSGT